MKTKFKFFPWSNYIKKQQLEVVYEKSCTEIFLQNSQENNFVWASFLIKFKAWDLELY